MELASARTRVHVVIALSGWLACSVEDPGDDATSTEAGETVCSTDGCATTSGSTTSTATGSATSGDEPASASGGSATTPGTGSATTTGTNSCAGVCYDCFECTYGTTCAQENSLCSVDPACSIALICIRDCIEESDEPAVCVAQCDCPSEGPLPALLACATGVCTENSSCPALTC